MTASLEQAQRIILEAVTPLEGVSTALLEAVGRVLGEDIVADIDIPPLDCSAKDGYAVIAADTQAASRERPVSLRIAGETQAGAPRTEQPVTPGSAVRIMTGAAMPPGADAVVRFEDTEEQDGVVKVFCPVDRLTNYRVAGENIRNGDLVMQRGERLNAADVGILASLNHDLVKVHRRPVVAVLSTGDELVEMGQDLAPGHIRDVNAHALCADLRKYGALPRYLGIARDSREEVRTLFSQALDADLVLSSGGGSMGKYDFVKEVYADLGVNLRFERVRIKPGKPCSFGTMDGKLFFSLPGNPVSAMTAFIQLVRPALLRLMGAEKVFQPVVSAVLDEAIDKRPSRSLRLLRGCFTVDSGGFHVVTTGDQKSSIFKSMREADCLIMLPPRTGPIPAGARVSIQLIRHQATADRPYLLA